MCFRCLTLLDWLEDVADVASFISTVDAHAYLYMSLRIVKMKTHGHLIFVPSQLLSIETTRGYVSVLTKFLTLSPSLFQLIHLHIILEPCI